MISRVAEDCFWLARYLERVESLARLLGVNLAFQLDVHLPTAERWHPLVVVTGEEEPFLEYMGAEATEDGEKVQEFLTWDPRSVSSILSSLSCARENARTVRETISLEMWESINELWLWLSSRAARVRYRRDRHAFYRQIRDRCVLIQGFSQNTMLHEEAFDFMRLGASLERTNQTARMLDVKYHGLGPTRADRPEMPGEAAQWLAILRSCVAIEPFFKRAGNTLSGPEVASFLIFEPNLPRSILHNLDRAWNFFQLIRRRTPPRIGASSAKLLRGLQSTVRDLSMEQVLERGIHDVLTWIVDMTYEVGTELTGDFFAPRLIESVSEAAKVSEELRDQGQRQTQSQQEPVTLPERHRVLSVGHRTVYRYGASVRKSQHVLRLKPVDDSCQSLLDHHLEISVNGERRDYEDVFGNMITRLEISQPFDELVIDSRFRVEVAGRSGELRSPFHRDRIPLVWMPWQRQMMLPYLLPPELPETELRQLSDFALNFAKENEDHLVESLLGLNLFIYRDFAYISGSTTLATTPYEVFMSRHGVCQDFANLLICFARLLGVPARYRSGYIYTGGNYENRVQSEASHAWVELYLPWTGWCGFDPTNGCLVGSDHVRVACGRNYYDATPTSGTIFEGGGNESLSVSVEVKPDYSS